MRFDFLEGDGEHQFRKRPIKTGDIFRFLGTPKDARFLLLEEPVQFEIEHQSTSGKDMVNVHYRLKSYCLLTNQVTELKMNSYTCYELVTEV